MKTLARTELYSQEDYEEEETANALECHLLQRRLQWKHADNEYGITQSV